MSSFNIACLITKVAFVFSLVGYIFLGAVLVMMSGFITTAREGQAIVITMLCGGIYIFGSLFAIGDRLNSAAMAIVGLILNSVGAVVWVPTIGSHEPQFAVFGILLSLFWLVCIILKLAE